MQYLHSKKRYLTTEIHYLHFARHAAERCRMLKMLILAGELTDKESKTPSAAPYLCTISAEAEGARPVPPRRSINP